MEQMINELGREDVYIFIFLIFAFLAGIVIFAVFIRGTRHMNVPEAFQPTESERAPDNAPIGVAEAAPSKSTSKTISGDASSGEPLVSAHANAPVAAIEAAPAQSQLKTEPKALANALVNTRTSFFGRLQNLFSKKSSLSAGEMDEIEEILYTSDLGPQTVERLLAAVQAQLKTDGGSGFEAVRSALKDQMLTIFSSVEGDAGEPAVEIANFPDGLERLTIWKNKPAVLMVVGVNGAGKTTTIGKLAWRLAQSGRRVLVAAGDTFRAAAGDQLKIWTERAQVEIFSPENVTDPSAVAYMACEAAQKGGFDVVIVDTAGRLHTQKNLMEELKKMKRVMTKLIPEAPHEVLLVLDANSGQNALIQAREFHQAVGVTGVVLTKLDGSAKGGIAVGLACELAIPIKLIGVGEGIDDLRRFQSKEFVDSII
jgi:fused signal recognition particle receptor